MDKFYNKIMPIKKALVVKLKGLILNTIFSMVIPHFTICNDLKTEIKNDVQSIISIIFLFKLFKATFFYYFL